MWKWVICFFFFASKIFANETFLSKANDTRQLFTKNNHFCVSNFCDLPMTSKSLKKKCKNNRIYGLHYRYLAGFQRPLPISLYIKMAPTAPTAMDRIATIMNWTMVPFLEPLFFSSLTLVIWNLTSSGELGFAATDEKNIVVVQNVYIY